MDAREVSRPLNRFESLRGHDACRGETTRVCALLLELCPVVNRGHVRPMPAHERPSPGRQDVPVGSAIVFAGKPLSSANDIVCSPEKAISSMDDVVWSEENGISSVDDEASSAEQVVFSGEKSISCAGRDHLVLGEDLVVRGRQGLLFAHDSTVSAVSEPNVRLRVPNLVKPRRPREFRGRDVETRR